MLGCLEELRTSLRDLGADLIFRRGRPEEVIPSLAREGGASSVHWTEDVSPFARRRDQSVVRNLAAAGIEACPHPGSYIVDRPGQIRSGQDRPYTVFSPFAKAWRDLGRRPREATPTRLTLAGSPDPGEMPTLKDLGMTDPGTETETSFTPGETAARKAAGLFLRDGVAEYGKRRNRPAGGTSRLSPYLRWGCLSPVEAEERLGQKSGEGPRVFRAELAWRDFYAAVLDNFPEVTRQEFQKRYRGTLNWQEDDELLEAWQQGKTGYPLVDAGMRELIGDGWMHNRVRMVVASFLTKDLHLDWREGERWFMECLLDGDVASNNGGWQWVTSVGTDPKPYFQRMFNPMIQQEKFDPAGEYVKRWIPELGDVPDEHLVRPWKMSPDEQEEFNCRIGQDYPEPVVDHAEERLFAIERYRAAVE
ncbi:MAG: deoxyribodipyrimidine photo-lyase [Solirubrobacterales bacterium]|nr:deoxyribodipyrimidine photo-lyase [Solirubrobacterales bacterium]